MSIARAGIQLPVASESTASDCGSGDFDPSFSFYKSIKPVASAPYTIMHALLNNSKSRRPEPLGGGRFHNLYDFGIPS
jgi:hypothetical protein